MTAVLSPPPGLPGLAPQPMTSGCQTVLGFPTNGAKAILVHPDYLNAAHGGPPLGAVACMPLGFQSHVSASVDRNSIVCLVTDSFFIF